MVGFGGFTLNHYAYGRVMRPERQATKMYTLNPYVALLGEKEKRLGNRRPLQHYPLTPDGRADHARMGLQFASVYPWHQGWYYAPDGSSKWSFISTKTLQ